jgi:hypothetical protein
VEYVVKVSVEKDGNVSVHFVEATDWRMEFDEGIRLLVTGRQCRVTLERCDEAPESGFVPGIRFYREICGGT